MKLSLLFIVMDLLTLLAYPIVFVYNKLRQFSKSKESAPVPNLLVIVPITPGR
jgi:NADH:ubiquinone oxidoreductase subunit 3 (subunit A)